MGMAAVALLWALREGQFDDLESPGMQVVLDDDRAPPPHAGAAPDADTGARERS
jgi:cbb3-type cytochrome oxidase maturation protein